MDICEAFKLAMHVAGIETDAPIKADGILHRIYVQGDRKGTLNGWYCLNADRPMVGIFGCWKRGIYQKWCYQKDYHFTSKYCSSLRAKSEAMKLERKCELERIHKECREKSAELWRAALPASGCHSYLVRKGIISFGLRYTKGALLVPVTDLEGNLHGVQSIYPSGDKRYLMGTDKFGHFFQIGVSQDRTLLIAEGYATGASLHMATEHTVVVAFDAGNLEPVAQVFRKRYPECRIIICADIDVTGIDAATKAAQATSAQVLLPKFMQSNSGTDWNDLHKSEGLDTIRRQMEDVGVCHV